MTTIPELDDRHAADVAALLRGADAVLLDFNGTLSLDEDLLESCYDEALRTIGLEPLGEGEYDGLVGLSERDISLALLRSRGEDAGREQELLDEVARAYRRGYQERSRIPAEHHALVRGLHERDVPLAIVTGTLPSMILPVLEDEGLLPLLRTVITIDDVAHGKPDPEGFLMAAERLGLEPSARIVICEDSGAGVRAAHAAGATAVGVGGGAMSELPAYRISSLAAALPHL